MALRRQTNQQHAVDGIYDQDDLDRRIEHMIDDRLDAALERRFDAIVDRLAERMGVLMVEEDVFDDDEEPIFDPYDDEENDIFETDGEPIFDPYDDEKGEVFEAVGDGEPIFDTEYTEEDLDVTFALMGESVDKEIAVPDAVVPIMEELKRQYENLLAKVFIQESLSLYIIPAHPTPKKDSTWRICLLNLKRFFHGMIKIRGRILSNQGRMMQWSIIMQLILFQYLLIICNWYLIVSH